MKPSLRGAVGAAGAALLVLGLAGPSVAAGRGVAARWTAALPGKDATLLGSASPDAHTVWVVGAKLVDRGPQRVPGFSPVLFARDDRAGQAWKQMPTAEGVPVRMNAVAAASDRDGWMVGDSGSTSTGARAGGVYTEHWNGRAWSVQQLALPKAVLGGGLLSVSAVGGSNAWAAGWVQVSDPAKPGTRPSSHDEGLVAHWNGKAWQRVALPRIGTAWTLNSITAAGADDVWAVGTVAQGDSNVPLALHYDGRSWTAQRGSVFGGTVNGANGDLTGIAAHGHDDVWAVGAYRVPGARVSQALIEHWNGHRWVRVAAPAAAGPLTGVAAAPGGMVAVGGSTDAAGDGYGLRVGGGRAVSLGLPANTAAARYAPWAVGLYGGLITVVGAVDRPGQSLPQPMVLTGRG
ncbi:hypothetical protein [Streptacidiphilus melanogenes]|uniref:hypothetical protein n=1 Tax=Streptacidiphilus melanogenes TaxID=411235 RepID=UPI0005AB836F|nr:hypothetical protein [Streptacidiphilus melanogenes]